METSDTLDLLAAALCAAQREMGPAKKLAANPHLGNKYADLSAVWEAVGPALGKHGLSVVQGVQGAPGSVTVTTMLLHASGQWLRDSLTLPFAESRGINIAQAAGSAITYARRYSLAALLSVPTEDDDGNAAHGVPQGQGRSAAPHGGPVVCPKCGGAMWDNRISKKSEKAPDYKCKNKACGGAVWDQPLAPKAPPEDPLAVGLRSVRAAAAANVPPIAEETLERHVGGRPLSDLDIDELRLLREDIKSGQVLPF